MTFHIDTTDTPLLTRMAYGLLVGGLLVGLSACGTGEPGLEETDTGALEVGQVAVQSTEERTVAPADRIVELNGLRGTLRLDGYDGNTAAWTFTKTARARDSTRARNLLQGLTVEEQGTEQRYTFALEGGTPDQSRIDVMGTLPKTAPLTVRRSSGVVDLSGLHGAVDVEQTHGNVRLEAMQGNVRIRVDNGDINVDWATLPVDAEVDLETQNGTIRITLPDTASTQLDVETTAGRVFSQGLSYNDRTLRASEAGYQFEGQLGAGEASIRARTTHGNIMLAARADTTNAAPDTTAPDDLAAPDTLIEDDTSPETTPDTTESDTTESDTTRASDDAAVSDDDGRDTVYTTVDEEPLPVGGLATLSEAATYPEEAAANEVAGRVYVQATVSPDGTVRDAAVLRGIGYGCDQEALRVVREATFEPAQRAGESVAARTTVWVQFTADDVS
ncbi:MAG: TonB family protein [Longimonas sp.]|uniref:TonB family protein n=1 Tax=Longimonas sp. TaxID=2039626 RepID=UPI003976994F